MLSQEPASVGLDQKEGTAPYSGPAVENSGSQRQRVLFVNSTFIKALHRAKGFNPHNNPETGTIVISDSQVRKLRPSEVIRNMPKTTHLREAELGFEPRVSAS